VNVLLNVYDVSMLIHENMIVYPGNPFPEIIQYSSIPVNKTNESIIRLGSHCGTHVDTKRHIKNESEGTASLPLNSFFGECQVLDLTHVKTEIHKKDLEDFIIKREDIIILKTKNSIFGYKKFHSHKT